MIFAWYREYKAAKALAEKTAYEERKMLAYKEAEEKYIQYREDMLSSPCAINNMQNCTEKCVHFRDGYAKVSYNSWDDFFYNSSEYPKCKLWK